MTKLYDCHLHSNFSGDSKAAQEEQIESAIEKGLSGITFTDHMDMDYPIQNTDEFMELDLPKYSEKILSLRKQYENNPDFHVYYGIELGLQPHLVSAYHDILKTYPFDFVIGSTHLIDKMDPYYDEYFDGKTPEEAYNKYFDTIIKNINSFDEFDSLGHLDYVVRYGKRVYGAEKGALPYEKYAEKIDAILSYLIKHDKALEVNTGAFCRGLDEPNPSYRIIERYQQMGGKLITMGADAHKAEHVGLNFKNVLAKLKEIGFNSYYIFVERKPIEITID